MTDKFIVVNQTGGITEVNKHNVKDYLKNGWSIQGTPVEKTPKDNTVVELKNLCTQKGIEFSNNIRKQDLLKLLSEEIIDEPQSEVKNEEDSNPAIQYDDGLVL